MVCYLSISLRMHCRRKDGTANTQGVSAINPKDIQLVLGRRVRQLRKGLGYSQESFAVSAVNPP